MTLRDQWLSQGNPILGNSLSGAKDPLSIYTNRGIPQSEAQAYLDRIAQLQGMPASGQEVTPNNDNDAFYRPSSQEEALLNQIAGTNTNWQERGLVPKPKDDWVDLLPYVFAGGAAGMIGSAGGLFGGAASGSAPYIGAGGSAATGATPGLLGETALGIGGAGTGMVAGAAGYPMPPAQSPPTGGAGGIFGGASGVGDFLRDYGNIIGPAIGGGLGYLGQREQTDALRDLGQQYFNIGAPFRSTLEQSYKPDFDLMAQPGYGDAFQRTADISAKAANVTYGNPYDASAQGQVMSDVWNQSYLPALANYRGQLGQFGGLGLNQSGAISGAGAGTAGSQYGPIAGAFGQMFKQDDPYEELARTMTQRYRLT